jgi:hypothetical protein
MRMPRAPAWSMTGSTEAAPIMTIYQPIRMAAAVAANVAFPMKS